MTSVPRNLRWRRAANHRLGVVEQIRDHDDEAAFHAVPRRAGAADGATLDWLPGCHLLERQHQRVQVARDATPAGRRNLMRSSKAMRPGRVALAVHEKSQRCRQHRAVFELAHRRRAAIRHRRADVEQQVAFEVGLFLELLDVVTIAARVDLPVECGEVVAGQVLPVFRELDAEPLVGTSVQTRDEALDHRPRLQLHRPQPRDDRRVEKSQVATGTRAPARLHSAAGRRNGFEQPLDEVVRCDVARTRRRNSESRDDEVPGAQAPGCRLPTRDSGRASARGPCPARMSDCEARRPAPHFTHSRMNW